MRHIIAGIFFDTDPAIEVAYSDAKEYPPGTHFPGASGPRPVPLVVETILYRTDSGKFYAIQVAPEGRSILMEWSSKQVFLWLYFAIFGDTMHISPALFQWVRESYWAASDEAASDGAASDWILRSWERLVDTERFEHKT